MPLPNLIIAGAPRCGTTSLFQHLSDHPEVCGSDFKETRFLMDSDYPILGKRGIYAHLGLEGYSRYFGNCQSSTSKIILDATPDYLYQKTVLEVLPLLKPQATLCFILRKPSGRLWSFYRYAKENMVKLPVDWSFPEYIERVKAGLDPEKFDVIIRESIEQTRYIHYMRSFKEVFTKEQIIVVLMEDMQRDPLNFMKNLCAKIGIDGSFYDSYTFTVKNRSAQVKHRYLHKYWRQLRMMSPRFPLGRLQIFKDLYYQLNFKPSVQPSDADRACFALLDEEFVPYNEELSKEFDIDLSIWKDA